MLRCDPLSRIASLETATFTASFHNRFDFGIGDAVIADLARLTEQRPDIIAIRRTDVRIEERDERVVHARRGS